MPNDTMTLIGLLFFLLFIVILMGNISATLFKADPSSELLCPDLYANIVKSEDIQIKSLPGLDEMTSTEIEERYGWDANASLPVNIVDQVWKFFFEFGRPLKILSDIERTVLNKIPIIGDILRVTTQVGDGINKTYTYFSNILSLMLSPCSNMQTINIIIIFPIIMSIVIYLLKSFIPFIGG